MIPNPISYLISCTAQKRFELKLEKEYFEKPEDFLNHFKAYPNYINEFKSSYQKLEHFKNYLMLVEHTDLPKYLEFIKKHNICIMDTSGNDLLMSYCINYSPPEDLSDALCSPALYDKNERQKLFPQTLDVLLASSLFDINAHNLNGLTPLMFLIIKRNYAMAEHLIDLGADALVRSKTQPPSLELDVYAQIIEAAFSTKKGNFYKEKEDSFMDKLKAVSEQKLLNMSLTHSTSTLLNKANKI